MAPPAAPPPPAPRPAGALPPRDVRPAAAARRASGPPPAWARHAATGAMGALAAALLLLGLNELRLARARQRLADVSRAQVQAEQIRRAWAELAAQGALLHARLS